jgi:hypothetical protein
MSLPDLSKLVAEQFAAIVTSGAIEKMIETHLSKSIDTILKEQLHSFSDFGKAVEERVTNALQVAELKNLPNYGQLVSTIIARNVDQQLHGEWAKKLESEIAAMFVKPPAEIGLDELVEKFKEHARENAFGDLADSITLHLESSSYGYWHVAMDQDDGKDKYQCDVRFQVNKEGAIFGLHLDDNDMKKQLFVGPFDAFERLIFSMYVNGTKVRIERDAGADDFDLSLHDED